MTFIEEEFTPTLSYNSCKLQGMVNEFAESGMHSARIIYDKSEYVNATSFLNALRQAIKSTGKK